MNCIVQCTLTFILYLLLKPQKLGRAKIMAKQVKAFYKSLRSKIDNSSVNFLTFLGMVPVPVFNLGIKVLFSPEIGKIPLSIKKLDKTPKTNTNWITSYIHSKLVLSELC